MAYNFDSIACIKRANGTEIKQIKKGTTTLWKKPYVWEKYNVTTSSETVMGWEAYLYHSDYGMQIDLVGDDYVGNYFYSSYTISSDGKFIGESGKLLTETFLDSSTGLSINNYFKTYPYFIDSDKRLTKFTSFSMYIWGNGNFICECDLAQYRIRQAEVSSPITQKGSYIENISSQTNSYPEDGISGNYWYTLISSPNTPGFNSSTSGSYSVEDVSGATYGFVLNNNGYYESTNNGVDYSYSICKVNININKTASLYIDCINYAETNYDFGILSNLNTSLSLDDSADTTNVKKSFKGSSSSAIQTVSYGSLSAGSYYIYIKFRKDSSQSSNNDSLQFKIRIE